MSPEKTFLDEHGMADLTRKSIEVLRQEGASPTELRRLETLLKESAISAMQKFVRSVKGPRKCNEW